MQTVEENVAVAAIDVDMLCCVVLCCVTVIVMVVVRISGGDSLEEF